MKLQCKKHPNLLIKGINLQFRDGVAEVDDSLKDKLGPYEKRYGVEVIDNAGPKTEEPKGLNDMTVKELKAHATEHGIDLGAATKKDDILEVLEGAPKAEKPEPAAEETDDSDDPSTNGDKPFGN